MARSSRSSTTTRGPPPTGWRRCCAISAGMTSWAWAGGSTRSGPLPGRAGSRSSSAGRSASPTRGCRSGPSRSATCGPATWPFALRCSSPSAVSARTSARSATWRDPRTPTYACERPATGGSGSTSRPAASGTGYPGNAPPSATSPAAASTRGRARRRWRRWTGRGRAPPPSAATRTRSFRRQSCAASRTRLRETPGAPPAPAAIAVGFATTAVGFAAGWLTGIGLPLLGNLHGRQARAIEPADAAKLAAIASAVVRVR